MWSNLTRILHTRTLAQVGGEVYSVNKYTLHIRQFTYDGNGKDTFFWAGSRPRPGPQGFIVPNERGR